MQVGVQKKCGRCGKAAIEQMELEAAQALADTDEERSQAEEALPELINNTLTGNHPDVVIAIRGADGSYTVKSQRGLCFFPEATKNKGCKVRVDALIDEIFLVKPQVTKPPKAAAPKKPPADGAKGKPDGKKK